jgi:2,3-bisphosphoglycerate-independent phosphoglycerate mutase
VLVEACEHANENDGALHLIGLVSDGGIHSSLEHFKAMIELAKKQEVKNVYVHVFTDGRDVAPKSAEKYLKILVKELKKLPNGKIATIQGRFYLDRDRDWDKTAQAVDLIVDGKGMDVNDFQAAIDYSYNKDVKDEFFEQFIVNEEGTVKKHDAVFFMHFRTDRMFQLQKALIDKDIEDVCWAGFLSASEDIPVNEAFRRPEVTNTLGETISEAGKTQLKITETEKYTHLTYFMNCGEEKEFDGETWEQIQSNRFVKPHYNFEPSMRAFDLTKRITDVIEENKTDFIAVNFPNCDMVGHTGNLHAAVVAAEAVDYALGKLYEAVEDKLDEYTLIVTADHGNAEKMWDKETKQEHTAHTNSPVPLIVVSDIDCKLDRKESLEDVAPTILDLMGIDKPEVMTGTSLILEK